MTAIELRIGNYILDKENEVRQVVELSRTLIRTSCDRILLRSEVDPIPLTEDILIKCGFTKVPLDSNNLEEGYYYEWDVTEGFCLLSGDKDDVFMCENDKVRFKYLHQVQNIIFALTGKELEINL